MIGNSVVVLIVGWYIISKTRGKGKGYGSDNRDREKPSKE